MNGDNQLITLTSDFGREDNYVAIMKGIIARINPSVRCIDITHDLPPQMVEAAVYQLETSYRTFPPGTIHLAVVDPGVGTERLPIMIESGDYFFVGPDNGIFSFLKNSDIKRIVTLENEAYFSPDISHTFHGRDLFAPAAGYLSQGVKPEELGRKLKTINRIRMSTSRRTKAGLSGKIIYVDHFGNLVSSVRAEDIAGRKAEVVIGNENLGFLKRTFGEAAPEEPLAYINSFGFVEIGVNLDSAAEYFGCTYGDKVQILFAS